MTDVCVVCRFISVAWHNGAAMACGNGNGSAASGCDLRGSRGSDGVLVTKITLTIRLHAMILLGFSARSLFCSDWGVHADVRAIHDYPAQFSTSYIVTEFHY